MIIFAKISELLVGTRQDFGNQNITLICRYRVPLIATFLFILSVMEPAQAHTRKYFGTHQPVPLSLIAKANTDAEFNTLRIWIVLKQLYKRNTVIYHLNYQTLSERTGLSHTCLRKHIKLMVENKWYKGYIFNPTSKNLYRRLSNEIKMVKQ